MTNNNDDKMNTEGNDSLLKYTGGTSYSSHSTPVSQSEEVKAPDVASQSPVQFESRRARRMSETGLMQQVPAPAQNAEKDKKESAPSYRVPVVVNSTLPVSAQTTGPAKRIRPSKEYWGGTAMLTSLSIFLVAQVIFSIVLVIYIALHLDLLTSIQAGTLDIEKVLLETPWLLLLSNGTMYAAWLGCMWWVTKYRSGVQAGKKFWDAFKDNFRLTAFKWQDILWGVGLAGFMLGLQYVVLNVIPQIFPSLKPIFEGSDNTGTFKEMDGLWFYVIAFGMGGVLGPICEELFFRGYLLRGFENHYSYKNSGRNMDVLEDGLGEKVLGIKSMFVSYRHFTHNYRYILAAIATSILFGLVHWQGSWLTCIMTGLLGLVFAIATLKLNRLYPAMIGHIIHNSAVFVVLALAK